MALSLSHQKPDREAARLRLLFGQITVLVFACVLIATRDGLLADPDIWWHIRSGQWMLQNGAWPTTDHFSYTFAGQPWIAKEWLSQVLYAAAFGVAGWGGVELLAVAALALATGVLFWSLSSYLKPTFAAMISLVVLALASSSFTARPHLLTLAIAVAWTHLLFSASWRGKAPRFIWLLLIMVWANLHAVFTVGFVIAFFAFLDVLERTRLTRKDVLLKWLLFLVLCPVVCLIHPYGWKAIYATWTLAGPNESIPLISEWQPFNALDDLPHELALLGLIFGLLASGFRLGLARALLVVLLLHMFLSHVRFAFFLFPLLPVLLAPELARQVPLMSAEAWRGEARDGVEKLLLRRFWPISGGIVTVLALFGLAQASILPTAPPKRLALTDALAFVRSSGITGNVFNMYDFGGPLIFNGIPTFIDGRNDQLFLGGFTKKFMSGPKTEEELSDALQKYAVTWTLLPPDDPRNVLLGKMEGWKRAYADPYAVIYVRANP